MGCAGLPSLVVLSAKLISLCSAVVDFLLLILVFNIGVHSLRTELCSLCSTTYYCRLFVVFPLTGMKPNDSFDVLFVWATQITQRGNICAKEGRGNRRVD